MMQVLSSTRFEGTLADGEKAFMWETVRGREQLHAELPPKGLPDMPGGALIRIDREV